MLNVLSHQRNHVGVDFVWLISRSSIYEYCEGWQLDQRRRSRGICYNRRFLVLGLRVLEEAESLIAVVLSSNPGHPRHRW